jgi:eukaryotic-like serine/threonine-protein kinase
MSEGGVTRRIRPATDQVVRAKTDDGVVADPGDSTTSASLPDIAGLEPGARFDRFRVIARLGAGGMGVVVSAFDPDLDRKVAIKVLRPEVGAGALTEAKAMARLTHPNVVTVHEVGTAGDHVFIVMELVEGQTLGTWIETRRPWREVVDVMLAAGRGLAAAHAAGLVHRDFKPHNVLIGTDGRVHVTDFGVVGVAGAAGGDVVIGTPAYMAPEQHERSAIDARADQYGFCVSLYEALYGVRPFDGDTPEALRAAVLDGTIETLADDRDVPSRLHEICLRGLARHPSARYPSMDALLAELSYDPARRRRRGAQVLGIIALAGVAIYGWARATPSTDSAVTSVCSAGGRSLDGVWDSAMSARMKSAFVAARPSQGADTFERTSSRLDDYAQRWTSAHTLACASRRSTTDAAFLGRVSCLTQLRDQLRELTTVFQRGPDGAVVDRAVTAVANLVPPETCAAVLVEPADNPTVIAIRTRLDHAEALWRAGLYREASDLAEKVAVDAAALPYPRLEAETLIVLAGARERLDDGDGAVAALDQAARAAAEAGADDLIARAYTQRLWVTAYVQSRSKDALVMQPFAEAAVVRAGDPPALRARLWFAIAAALIEQGRYDEAVPYLERARDVWQKELDPRHPDAARPLISLGNVANYTGHDDEAVRYYEEALRLREDALGSKHPDLAGPLGNLGGVYNKRGEYDRAVAYCSRALDIIDATFGPNHGNRENQLECLAEAHQGKGDLARARALLEEGIAQGEDAPETSHYYYLLTALADVLSEQGEHARALDICDKALAYFTPRVPPEHPDLALALTCRGRALVDLGQPAVARPVLERALALRAAGAPPSEMGKTHFALARALPRTERAHALELANQALAELRTTRSTRDIAAVEAWLKASSGTPSRRGAAPR